MKKRTIRVLMLSMLLVMAYAAAATAADLGLKLDSPTSATAVDADKSFDIEFKIVFASGSGSSNLSIADEGGASDVGFLSGANVVATIKSKAAWGAKNAQTEETYHLVGTAPSAQPNATTYTITLGVANATSGKTVTPTEMNISIRVPGTNNRGTPEFKSKEEIKMTAGDTSAKSKWTPELKNYKSTEVQWTIDDTGSADLAAIGMVFSGDTLMPTAASQAPESTPAEGVKFILTAEGDKEKSANRTFTLKVAATKPEVFSDKYPKNKAKLGDLYNATVKGVIVGQPLSGDWDASAYSDTDNVISFDAHTKDYQKALVLAFKGTRPLTVAVSGLPEGVTGTVSTVTSNDKTKIASVDVTLTGTPTTAGTYTPTIAVTNHNSTQTFTYNLVVLEAPTIDAPEEVPDVTWNTTYSFVPSSPAGKAVTWALSQDVADPSKYLTEKAITALGLKFAAKNGAITGKWNKVSSDTPAFESNADTAAHKLRLVAKGNGGNSYRDVDIKFNLPAPIITTKLAKADFTYGTQVEKDASKFIAKGSGYGTLKWAAPEDLPKGLAMTDSGDGAMVLHTEDTGAQVAVKGQAYTFTLSNAAGEVTVAPKITVTVDKLSWDTETAGYKDPDTDELFSGDHAVDEEYGPVTIRAYPGPIKWSAKLPGGLTLTPDAEDTEKAVIAGTFNKAAKKADYTITATNTYNSKAKKEVKKTATVYARPEITTTKLPDIKVGSPYTAKLAFKNNPTDTDADIKVNVDEAHGGLDYDAKKYTITGSIDRMPTGDVTVKVTASTKYGDGKTLDAEPKEYTVNVKGAAPKFKTSKLNEAKASETKSTLIETTGTLPITITAMIAAADAKKAGLNDGEDISLVAAADGDGVALVTGGPDLTFTESKDTDGDSLGTGTLTVTPGDKRYVFKNLPITFTAENSLGSVTKKFSLNITGEVPVWYVASEDAAGDGEIGDDDYAKAAASLPLTAVAGKALSKNYSFKASGDLPLKITPATTTTNGLTLTADTDNNIFTLTGTPTEGKETKTTFNLVAQNPSTGKKATLKLTVQAKLAPEITTAEAQLTKEGEVGKNFSFKPAAKGSKTIKWYIFTETADDGAITEITEDTPSADKELKNKYGLTFNSANGAISGKATKPTLNSNYEYEKKTYYLVASNDAGMSDIKALTIGIKGQTPKFTTKSITIDKDKLAESEALSNDNYRLITLNTAASKDILQVTYSTLDDTEAGKLSALGLTLKGDYNEETPNKGVFDDSNTDGFVEAKGSAVKFKATNYGTDATGSVKFTIYEKNPVVSTDDEGAFEDLTTTPTKAATAEMKFNVTVSGDEGKTYPSLSNLKWKINSKPKGATMGIKVNDDGTATVSLTVAKKKSVDGTFTVTVTDGVSKKNHTTGSIKVKAEYDEEGDEDSALPDDDGALPELIGEAKTVEDVVLGSGTVTLGEVRTEESLTAEQRAFLEEGGYVVVKVLPEMTANESGQYDVAKELDLDSIELAEAAKEGAELVYFAFPVEAETTEDDEIVDFFDVDGADTEVVPEDKQVLMFPWFTADKTYAPVIAIKADSAEGAKDSAEELAEGDVITEKAVEAK